jgi:hydrogenase maturation protease
VTEERQGPGERAARAGVLVIGYGNALRSDDGVGWHAAHLLANDPRLARADVIARHQLAPELALDFGKASLVVLIDASAAEPPGTIAVRRVTREPGGAHSTATLHHFGPQEIVELARELYGAAPEVCVVGVGISSTEAGEELSPAVAAALPAVADAVAGLVADHLRRLDERG